MHGEPLGARGDGDMPGAAGDLAEGAPRCQRLGVQHGDSAVQGILGRREVDRFPVRRRSERIFGGRLDRAGDELGEVVEREPRQAAVEHGDDETAGAVDQEGRAFAGGIGDLPAGELAAAVRIEHIARSSDPSPVTSSRCPDRSQYACAPPPSEP